MKIALDASHLYIAREGIARYVRGLLGGLASFDHPGAVVEPVAWEVENFGFRQPLRAMKTAYREFVWGRAVAPRLLRAGGFDLLHSQGDVVPPASFSPQVITLHDLAPLHDPGSSRPWFRHRFRARLDYLKKARRIHCISAFTADEAHRMLGLPLSRIEVIHHGVDTLPAASRIEADAFFAAHAGPLPEEFLLVVGSLKPNKNLRLLRAVYLLAEEKGIALPPLLVVGDRIEGIPGEGNHPKAWRCLGHVPDAILGHLYGRALAFLFPSLYEGFGFPPLEAMRLGCPVVCGRAASLPEVCGEAALYAELSPLPFLETVQRLLTEPGLREEKREEGLRHSARFTWGKCARETLSLYRTALDTKS